MRNPIIFACLVYLLDQASKFFIEKFIPYASAVNIIETFHFFNIVNVSNTGIAFSFFENNNLFFIIFMFLFLTAISIWLYKNRNKISPLQKYAFCLVLSGGIGNLTDRIFRGAVVDFLDFGINNLRWPAFNIADSAVCIAMFLIIFSFVKEK
ncbi:MAG: signal peptidase II [Elusimicrobiota bacterium]|jgi:signal peptidase II|nr:signal peptidase II [Elusimicrobiota bacterium]